MEIEFNDEKIGDQKFFILAQHYLFAGPSTIDNSACSNTNKKLSSQELEIFEAIRAARLRPAFLLGDSCIAQQMRWVANHYNISNALDNTEETVFFDFCHVSPAANRKIAKAIVDTLYREGQLDRILKSQ